MSNFPQEIALLVAAYLKRLERKGVRSVYLTDDGKSTQQPEAETRTAGMTVEQRLSEIEAAVKTCTLCALHEGRTHAVFGKGNPMTKVMFIGEGPGRDEDLKGEPFVGRSGQLLTKILEAIDLKRSDVYITNMVKCRPPQNRDPLDEEVKCCERYLIEQIEFIRPRLICALGRIAAQWLLGTKEPLTSLRNAENLYRGTPVLVTYHPAALLRNPELKREAWEDFKKLKALIAE